MTRRQQKLQITAEDPPSFLGAPTHDLRLEKAEVKADMRKVCGSNANDVEKEKSVQSLVVLDKGKEKGENDPDDARTNEDDEVEGMRFVASIPNFALL